MNIDDLVFVGLNGYVLAMDRKNGEIAWFNDKLKSGYVSLLLDGDRLVVSTNGYIYCLDPLNGIVLWENPLKGYGTGVASIVSVRGQSTSTTSMQAAAKAASEATTTGAAAAASS